MSDHMRRIPMGKLVKWVFDEYEQNGTIFSVGKNKFFQKKNENFAEIFGEKISTIVGPAAGPHSQLCQNIIASYLAGARFFEIKTVQILDKLELGKPCIESSDECYNTEWSTELAIGRWSQDEQERKIGEANAFDEYVKAWFILHILDKKLGLSSKSNGRFVFNMSVGYNLEGILDPKVDQFIEGLKDASSQPIFAECKQALKEAKIDGIDDAFVEAIPAQICKGITLSTMHGCPPDEIEKIVKYLLETKKLNVFAKLNPTLLGSEFLQKTWEKLGFDILQKQAFFDNDLKIDQALPMIERLIAFAKEQGKEFGVKLSNTLQSINRKGILPGDEMYMSGRALYPLTINLAAKLAKHFKGDLKISYSGGADAFNIEKIAACGIRPITLATSLLKPGGYDRFNQLASIVDPLLPNSGYGKVDVDALQKLADSVFDDINHKKENHPMSTRKIDEALPMVDCFIDPCSVQCPIGQDIPDYLDAVAHGEYAKALQIITAKNPLPFITGTICPHTCMNKCTRMEYDQSVAIREMKLLAAEKGLAGLKLDKGEAKGVKVAVIGAGPAGIASSYFLAREGFAVDVFEKTGKAGGTVVNVIPDFRISRESIAKDVSLAEKLGVKFNYNCKDFDIEKLKEDGYKYVVLAIGAGKHTFVDLQGGQSLNAINFLSDFVAGKAKVGKKVAVIGGGNTAMDAARAAKRLADDVYIVYRRTIEQMPADLEELELAQEDGVIFKNLLSPVSYDGKSFKCEVMELGAKDSSGRARPVGTGKFGQIAVDTVISSIGDKVDWSFLNSKGVNKVISEFSLETDLRNVYIAGDVQRGPATVVEAIADATKVAKSIMFKEGVVGFEDRFWVDDIEVDEDALRDKKAVMVAPAQGEKEAERCLGCDTVCNICSSVCPNRANVQIRVEGLEKVNQVVHIDGMCNECGNCGFFCPYIGEPYKEKFTLFWTERDFCDNQNNGFVLIESGDAPKFKVKVWGEVLCVDFDEDGCPDAGLPEGLAEIIWACYTEHKYLFAY